MHQQQRLRYRLHAAARALISLVFPERCQLCHHQHASPESGFVCTDCRAGLVPIVPPACDRCGLPFSGALTQAFVCPNCQDLSPAYTRARAPVHARGVIREAIHLYKYHRALWLEPFFADILRNAALPDLELQTWSGIVPVPLHPVRRREREFNQAERLAHLLAKPLGIPVHTDLVLRLNPTQTQTNLSRRERIQNVRAAFGPARNLELPGTRWIVVDDVLTTGSTTDAVARVLREAGAEEVVVWTLARGV